MRYAGRRNRSSVSVTVASTHSGTVVCLLQLFLFTQAPLNPLNSGRHDFRTPQCRRQKLSESISRVSVWQRDRVGTISNYPGNLIRPSYVSFSDVERLIGDAAKNQVAINSVNTAFDAKRLIGRKFDDADVWDDMKHLPSWSSPTTRSWTCRLNTAWGDLVHELPEDEGDRCGLPRNHRHRSRRHRPCILQRLPACRYRGRRCDHCPQRPPYHQQTHHGRYRLWSRQGTPERAQPPHLCGGVIDVSFLTIDESSRSRPPPVIPTRVVRTDNRLVNHFVQEFKRKNKKGKLALFTQFFDWF